MPNNYITNTLYISVNYFTALIQLTLITLDYTTKLNFYNRQYENT